MATLDEETKELLSKNIELSSKELILMEADDIKSYIEKKIGKKLTYKKCQSPTMTNSGHDSVFIDSGRIITEEEINEKIDKMLKNKDEFIK